MVIERCPVCGRNPYTAKVNENYIHSDRSNNFVTSCIGYICDSKIRGKGKTIENSINEWNKQVRIKELEFLKERDVNE